MRVQIERWVCNGQANQQWDLTRVPATGAIRFVSVFFPKCWSNGDAGPGRPLTLLNCSLGSADNKNFYFEYQGLVPNCGKRIDRKVRPFLSAIGRHPP